MKRRDKKVKSIIYMITIISGAAILIYFPTGSMLLNKKDAAEVSKPRQEKNITEAGDNTDTSITLMSSEIKPSISVTPTPTVAPTPTPLPVYPLEERGFAAELEEIVKVYYEAKVNCDIDTLKTISSDQDRVISKKKLLQLVEGIDDYQNIICYVKKSYEEGAYIIFVYYDIKFIGLKTLAPSLSKLYVVTDDAGDLKLYDGELTDELRAYIKARSEDEDVIKLREYTDQLAEEAKEMDKDLKAFWELLDNY